jgi:hypothetical protein
MVLSYGLIPGTYSMFYVEDYSCSDANFLIELLNVDVLIERLSVDGDFVIRKTLKKVRSYVSPRSTCESDTLGRTHD